ncbi:MAG TPA: HAMP domain-containing protein, partial [Chloroflexota bacterium]
MWPGWTDAFVRHARAAAARVEAPLLRLSLQRRIVVFVTCVVVAIVLAFAFLGSQAVSQSTAATLQERQATAVVMARHLDDFVGDGQASLSVVATELVDDQGELERDRAGEVMDRAMQQLYLYFATLMLLSPDGQPIATAPPVAAFELTPAAHAVLERARETQRQAVSNRLRLPTADTDGMLFVAPVVRNGRVLALVAGTMPLPHPALTSLSTSLHLGETGHMEVIDADGQLLASQGLDNETTTEHPDFYLPMLRSGSAGVGRAYSAHEAEWHIMAFAPLSDAPWGVGVGQTEAETFAATVELRDRTLAAAAAALALTLGFAWIGTQSVVKPIRALTRAGERMATGDLSEPIDLPQPDEIGRLARVLDTMRQRLRRGIDEAAEWNHQLEARVRQRTRELETSNRYLHTMMRVATAANAGTDHEPVMRIALETLVATLHARGAWVSLYDADSPRLRLVSEYRLPPSVRACEVDIDRHDAFCIQTHVLAHRPCWVAPIRVDHRPLGVLCLVGRPRQELGVEAQDLLLGVAQQIGMALQKARLADDRARLEASRRMEVLRAEFLASVSHELRTPLGFIKGYATTLLRQDVHWDAAQQRE